MVFLIFSCSNFFQGPSELREEVTIDQAAEALNYGRTNLGDPYEWGGDGPDSFDCSGLIVWSYQQISPYDYIFTDGSGLVDDINMDTMHDFNVRLIDIAEVVPGDIIFITDNAQTITHGGMVMETSGSSVTFLHASSFHSEVRIDTWELNAVNNGQWIEGFGRMIIRK